MWINFNTTWPTLKYSFTNQIPQLSDQRPAPHVTKTEFNALNIPSFQSTNWIIFLQCCKVVWSSSWCASGCLFLNAYRIKLILVFHLLWQFWRMKLQGKQRRPFSWVLFTISIQLTHRHTPKPYHTSLFNTSKCSRYKSNLSFSSTISSGSGPGRWTFKLSAISRKHTPLTYTF